MIMTVGMKIRGGFLIGAVITIAIGGFGLYGNLTPTRSLNNLGLYSLPLIENLHSLNYQRTLIRSYIHELMASESDFNRMRKLETIKTESREVLREVDEIWADFTGLPEVSGNSPRYQEIHDSYAAWRNNYCTLLDRYIDPLLRTPEGPGLTDLYDEYTSAMVKAYTYSYSFYAASITLLNQTRRDLEEDVLHNTERGFHITVIMLAFMAAGFLAAVVLGFVVSGMVVKPLERTFTMLKAIAEGDLTKEAKVTGADELAQMMRLLNQTKEGIKTLITAIQDKARNLSGIGAELSDIMVQSASAVRGMTSNTQDMKNKAAHQSSDITETNDATERIVEALNALDKDIENQAATISRSSSAIEEMAATTASVTQNLIRNEKNVESLAAASRKGREGLRQVAEAVMKVTLESERLLEINKVIQNIASQTNLLARTAAIEAAHAGAVGRGFAVVSDEIRKLAESSSSQAKTVSSVLKEIKGSLDSISLSTETALTHFEDIDNGVRVVSELETQIRNAMEEQDAGSREILETIGISNNVTQNVRAGSREMLTDSREIIEKGKNLETLTSDLTDKVGEIASGMDQLNATINRIQGMSQENKQSIAVLMEEITRFKI
ncbi:MAG: methyl-accepting chemotaxis protein [Spirochaetaceae bacterium]|jgi:methyl-accepting chemotaxis protein|nr:methyl-accepting chemotaxis protein [Spirochaetaceae bacterium]